MMTHPTWELMLGDTTEQGTLVLMPCPGTKDFGLQESIEQLKQQGVTTVVTALDQQEMSNHGVSNLPNLVEAKGLNWLHAPIEDDQVPDELFIKKWGHLSSVIHTALDKGEKVALHCMGGSGCTGLLAAHILLEKQWPIDDIITKVQALRPGAFTKPVQIDYVNKLAEQTAICQS